MLPPRVLLVAVVALLGVLGFPGVFLGAARADDVGLIAPEQLKEHIPAEMLDEEAKFNRPELSAEEEFAPQIPRSMRCDACYAVAYQLERSLDMASDHGKRRLDELQVLEAAEDVCKTQGRMRRELERRQSKLATPEDVMYKDATSVWDAYGVKSVDSINRITGEGMAANAETGVTMVKGHIQRREHKGKPWSGRLARFCETLVGELGEDDLYQLYLEVREAKQEAEERRAQSKKAQVPVKDQPLVGLDTLRELEQDFRRELALAQYKKFNDNRLDPASFQEQVCGRLHRKECVDLERRRLNALAPENPMLPYRRVADPVAMAEDRQQMLEQLRQRMRREKALADKQRQEEEEEQQRQQQELGVDGEQQEVQDEDKEMTNDQDEGNEQVAHDQQQQDRMDL